MSKVYACSDLHGMYSLFEQIKNFIQPDDIVYCLGDCGDRGPSGWRIISEVMDNPQWKYLKGNHEDMLAKAIKSNHRDYCFSEEQDLLYYNGGRLTYEAWEKETQWDESWGKRLHELPYYDKYYNTSNQMILLSHSGCIHPDQYIPERDCLWDRSHMGITTWPLRDDVYIVHGHTPVALARKGRAHPELLKIENYCDGHKFNIDLASWYTGVCCLLDLDTFEEHYFYTTPIERN